MTPDARTATALRIYADDPLPAGDAVLLLDGRVCMEVAHMADEWDEVLRVNTAVVLRETARSVVLAIARPGADLQVEDHRIWRELHDELRGSDVDLWPLQALPAACRTRQSGGTAPPGRPDRHVDDDGVARER